MNTATIFGYQEIWGRLATTPKRLSRTRFELMVNPIEGQHEPAVDWIDMTPMPTSSICPPNSAASHDLDSTGS